MELKNRNILLISPEPWSHLFVSKHHYAIHLGKRGNRVYFLNPPSKTDLKLTRTEYDEVQVLDYNGFVKGLRFLPSLVQRYVMLKTFKKFQNICGCEFDVVWSFDNSVFFDFRFLPKKVISISHIVDMNQDFMFARSSATADICLAVTNIIREKQEQYNSRCFFIQHGVSVNPTKPITVQLDGDCKIKALYAGYLASEYLNIDLLFRLAIQNKDVDFVFAGSGNLNTKLLKLPNCYCIGKIPSENLLDYYMASDILLLAYREQDFPKQLTNSHKMMGYLLSGKMICATWTNEYEILSTNGLIGMYSKKSKFLDGFSSVKNNLDFWNSKQKAESRKVYAKNNSYEKQIERIELLIKDI